MRRVGVWGAFGAAAVLLACAAKKKEPAEVPIQLECALSVPAKLTAGEPVHVRFKLTNRSERPVSVLTWQTPLEGLFGDVFDIRRGGGEALPYEGPQVKRGDPEADEYALLAPGASVDAEVDVSLAYPVKTPGHYRIAFRGPLHDVAPLAEVPRKRAGLRQHALACAPVETELVAAR